MTLRGSAAEGILLKMLLQNGIEAEHGSPSRPGDIIVPPNVIIELKDTINSSYSFKEHSGKGEAQLITLRGKVEQFPWIEVFYVVRFRRKDWRYYPIPESPGPLRLKDGRPIAHLMDMLKEKQALLANALRESAVSQSQI